ncbi:proline-rich protein 2-like [Moschus berezovskii]|uniref:proline-rich protein 2-like n=1 Tax=Moschus berezovskii TaxID=68408 RepID=UPI002444728C|nr:proline-rich protein 2-like [Moschus berezovskii]
MVVLEAEDGAAGGQSPQSAVHSSSPTRRPEALLYRETSRCSKRLVGQNGQAAQHPAACSPVGGGEPSGGSSDPTQSSQTRKELRGHDRPGQAQPGTGEGDCPHPPVLSLWPGALPEPGLGGTWGQRERGGGTPSGSGPPQASLQTRPGSDTLGRRASRKQVQAPSTATAERPWQSARSKAPAAEHPQQSTCGRVPPAERPRQSASSSRTARLRAAQAAPEKVDRQLCRPLGAPSAAPPHAFQLRCFSDSPAFKRRDRDSELGRLVREPWGLRPVSVAVTGSEGLLVSAHVPGVGCASQPPPGAVRSSSPQSTPRPGEAHAPRAPEELQPEAPRGPSLPPSPLQPGHGPLAPLPRSSSAADHRPLMSVRSGGPASHPPALGSSLETNHQAPCGYLPVAPQPRTSGGGVPHTLNILQVQDGASKAAPRLWGPPDPGVVPAMPP